MATIIASERFELTPAIRQHIEEALAKVKEGLGPDLPIRVFLSKNAKRAFTVLCKVHVRGRDLVARESGEDLYNAVSRASLHLKRILVDRSRKRIHQRRKRNG